MGFLRCGKRVSYKTGLCRYDSFGPKRVGFGCFPTRFAQVAAAFAGSWACGRCACERGAWEEGRGGGGVRAMGSCQGVFGCGIGDWSGDGDGPAPRPCPGFPLSRERRWGGVRDARGLNWWPEGPFDRLRANGISKRACDVGWWGRAAARRTSGYRLSPVRRWRVWEVSRERRRDPRRAPALGSRRRRERRWGGVGRAAAGGGGGALRQAQGERNLEARLRCGLVGACRRPADAFAGMTRVVRNDGGGVPRGGWRQAQGERNPKRACGLVGACPARRTWVSPVPMAGVGSSRGAPRAAPLSRENDGWGVCGTRGSCWWRRALRQAQGERNRDKPLITPMPFYRLRANGTAPAPLDSCLRRNDARRRRPRAVPLPWVPAFARTTVGGVCVCGTRGGWEWWRRGGCGWGREPFDRLRANGNANRPYGCRRGERRSGEWIGLDDGAYAAVHVYGGAGYEAGSL